MFWKFNLITTSHVETILSKENVTLKELMDEEDILQECKAQNKNLIDFLTKPEIMEELVTLITQEPSEEIEEKSRYKYPNVACELLTSDVGGINDALATNEMLLNKLYNFIDTEKPLNPLLASFFSKSMSLLITKKTDTIFEYLKSKEDFLSLILNHLETSAIMDLLLRMVSCLENNDSHSAIVQWLNEQNLVKRLVSLVDPAHSEDQNCNAATALCDIVKFCREHMSLLQEKAEPDPLLEAIESTEMIADLLHHMFHKEKRECVLVNGILVILSLLEFKRQGPAGQHQLSQAAPSNLPAPENIPHSFSSIFFRNDGPEHLTPLDAERLNSGVERVLNAVTPRLEDFTKLLVEPPVKPSVSTSVGRLEKPLGWTRLEVTHLLSALVHTNNHKVNMEMSRLGTVNILLDLFFQYTWNNFLHTQVEQLIGTVLHNGPTTDQEGNSVHPLLQQLFEEGKIIQKMLDAWEENEIEQCKPGKHRKGYMGHLTKIANHVVQNADNGTNSEMINLKLKELPEDYLKMWETFSNETLQDLNKKHQTAIVPMPKTSLDNDCSDFRDGPFTQETALQQAFSDYQMQQMTSNFVDQFGFNDEEFLESDDNITGQLDRLARVNFQFVADDNMRQAELFEQKCRERDDPLGDADSDEDVWEDKEHEITFASGISTDRRLTTEVKEGSDSDEEIFVVKSPGGTTGIRSSSPIPAPQVMEEIKMDVDQTDPWSANFGPPTEPTSVAMDTTNPWETNPASGNASDQSWADFSGFSPFSSNEFSVPSPIAMETTAFLKDENLALGSKTIKKDKDNLESTKTNPDALTEVKNEDEKLKITEKTTPLEEEPIKESSEKENSLLKTENWNSENKSEQGNTSAVQNGPV